jgi:hypothetical protein
LYATPFDLVAPDRRRTVVPNRIDVGVKELIAEVAHDELRFVGVCPSGRSVRGKDHSRYQNMRLSTELLKLCAAMSPVARLAKDLISQGQNLVGADYMCTRVATRHIDGLGLGKL